uniref:SJCHGC02761 protein n=1 Tax=Schistosoma japonicum TaxID=6182 RepID=Q5DC49_SCHJA|nr:SJCHGC02761 protein [Schistosoma japonicum]
MCKVISSTILVLFNIPLVLVGLGLVVFGALIRWNEKILVERITPVVVEEIDDENAREAAQKLIEERITLFASYGLAIFFFGLFICILSLCGVCGVCCKSKILLGLYAAFLLVIFLALLVFTIVFGTRKHWFRDELGISYRRSITSDYHMDNNFPPNTGFTVFVNEIQQKHKCCGSFDYRDFQDNDSFKRQNYKIPASCCKDMKDKECWERPTSQNSYKDTGCFRVSVVSGATKLSNYPLCTNWFTVANVYLRSYLHISAYTIFKRRNSTVMRTSLPVYSLQFCLIYLLN